MSTKIIPHENIDPRNLLPVKAQKFIPRNLVHVRYAANFVFLLAFLHDLFSCIAICLFTQAVVAMYVHSYSLYVEQKHLRYRNS